MALDTKQIDIQALKMKLPPSKIKESVNFMFGTGISFYVHGAPGISKSAVVKQVANDRNIAFIDFRLTSVAPEDIRGIPEIKKTGGMTGLIWNPPLVFPRDLDLFDIEDVTESKVIEFYNPIGENGIFYCKKPEISVECLDKNKTADIISQQLNRFVVVIKDNNGDLCSGKILWKVVGKSEALLALEEFNSAEPAVQAASYQLILDRRIGSDYIVPDGVMICALGNRDGDKGITHALAKPVGNRFVHIEAIIHQPDWIEWGLTDGDIDTDIIAYMMVMKTELFDEKFATHKDLAWRSPRTWEFVSKIIKKQKSFPVSTQTFEGLVCGAIGPSGGVKFLSYIKFAESMPNIDKILDGTVSTFYVSDQQYKTQISYSTCIALARALKEEENNIKSKYKNVLDFDKSSERAVLLKRADRAIGYVMDNFMADICVVFGIMISRQQRLKLSTSKMENWLKFMNKYGNSING